MVNAIERRQLAGTAKIGIMRSIAVPFVCLAIQSQKPTLLLTRGKPLGGTFRSALSSDFVRNIEYETFEQLEKAVTDFLADNSVATKDLRFNFFLDRKIHTYLRWISYKTGKPQSEIIREVLHREIERDQKPTKRD